MRTAHLANEQDRRAPFSPCAACPRSGTCFGRMFCPPKTAPPPRRDPHANEATDNDLGRPAT